MSGNSQEFSQSITDVKHTYAKNIDREGDFSNRGLKIVHDSTLNVKLNLSEKEWLKKHIVLENRDVSSTFRLIIADKIQALENNHLVHQLNTWAILYDLKFERINRECKTTIKVLEHQHHYLVKYRNQLGKNFLIRFFIEYRLKHDKRIRIRLLFSLPRYIKLLLLRWSYRKILKPIYYTVIRPVLHKIARFLLKA